MNLKLIYDPATAETTVTGRIFDNTGVSLFQYTLDEQAPRAHTQLRVAIEKANPKSSDDMLIALDVRKDVPLGFSQAVDGTFLLDAKSATFLAAAIAPLMIEAIGHVIKDANTRDGLMSTETVAAARGVFKMLGWPEQDAKPATPGCC